MNADPNAPQALTLFYLIGGGLLLLTFAKTIIDTIVVFRRQPPIEQTLAALMREFNSQLCTKVDLSQFNACESRHLQQIRDIESRTSAEIRAMENRIDARLTGLHSSLKDVREQLSSAQSGMAETLMDVMRDLGFTQGAQRPTQGRLEGGR